MNPMLSCAEARALFSSLLAGSIDPGEQEALEEHLRRCRDCEDASREMVAQDLDLREFVVRSSAEAASRLGKSLRAESAKVRTRRLSRTSEASTWKIALIAAAVFAAILATVWVSSSGPAPDGEADLRAVRERRLHEQAARREAAVAREARERLEKEVAAKEEERRKLEESARQAQDEKKRQELLAREAELARVAEEARARMAQAKKAEEAAQAAIPKSPEPPSPAPTKSAPAPVQETRVAVARIERARDAFAVTVAGRRPLKPGEDFVAGQTLEVGEGGALAILYPDQTLVEVGPGAELQDVRAAAGKRLWIAKGAARAVVAKQPAGQPMVFATPYGEATVLGTTLRLRVDEGAKEMRLDVEEGRVRLKNLEGKTVEVVTGHFAVAIAGGELSSRPLFLFTDDFDRGSLSAWRRPAANPWRVVKTADGTGSMLEGGAWTGANKSQRYEGALIGGQAAWKDYAIEASVRYSTFTAHITDSDGVLLLARVKDSRNFYWLEHSVTGKAGASLMILKMVDGRTVPLKSATKQPLPGPEAWQQLRFEVNGASLRGFLNGALLVEAQDPDLAFGGIGLIRADVTRTDNIIHWDHVRVLNLAGPGK